MVTEEHSRRQRREAFGRALAKALDDAELTQKELSERLGGRVAQNTISEWKNGQSEPSSPELAFEVERALDVEPGGLTGFLGYLPPSAAGSVEAALSTSDVDEKLREVLLNLYREIKRQAGGR
jgi:transcriptional regulator with XRE-family HTH domain